MKVKAIVSFFLLVSTMVLAKDSKLIIENNFFSDIKISVLRGGSLDEMPPMSKKVEEATIKPFLSEEFTFDIKNSAIFWMIIRFENGSEYIYDPVKLREEDRITITIQLDSSEKVDSSENYYKDLQNDFYGGIDIIVEKDIDNKGDIFKSLYGGLAIARTKKSFFSKEFSRVNYLSAKKLKRSLNVGFKKNGVKNYNYVISDSVLRKKIDGVPGVAEFQFSDDPATIYDINFAVTGLQNYDYEDEKTIEESWNDIEDAIDRDLFLRNFIHAFNQNHNVYNQKIEVREYNKASGFKGMYVRVDTYSPIPKNEGDPIVFVTEKGPYYLQKEKAFQDIHSESVLAIGFKGDDKTQWVAELALAYIDRLKTNVKRTNNNIRKEILNELGVQGYERVNQEEYLTELDAIKDGLSVFIE